MPTKRGLDRMVAFTDAIVAIAITLLILPLVDAASESDFLGGSAADFFAQNWPKFGTFLISFAVIARLWLGHHRIFEHLEGYTPRIMLLTLAWAFTIVVLPLPTVMTANFGVEPGVVAFYIATMTASSLLLTLLVIAVRRSPAQDPANPIPREVLANSASTTVLFGVALVLGVVLPAVNYYALFVLVLSLPVGGALRRRSRRDARRAPVDG